LISETNKHVTKFAEEGLRTLFIARREIDDAEYNDWNAQSE
jgi:magnesium-transporting ATPase (P-type)